MLFCALVYNGTGATQVHADQKTSASTAAQIVTDHTTAVDDKKTTEAVVPHLKELMKRIKTAKKHHTRDRAAETELKAVLLILTENFNHMNGKVPQDPLYDGKIANIKMSPVKTSKPDPTHPPTTK